MYELMRSTWRIETMVFPELSRTTRITVNRLAREGLNLNQVVLELSKQKETCTSSSRNVSSIRQEKHDNFSVQAYSFLEVNKGVSEEKPRRANMIPMIRICLLYLQILLITAGPGVTI